VPQVNADGNETSGIRMPAVEFPLATQVGWNLRTPAIGAPGEMFSLTGAWFPFAGTKAGRQKSGDPRLSVEERYAGRADYVSRIEKAARKLAQTGFLLDQDVPRFVERAGAEWDLVTGR
jgi:hypothetical protein